MSEQGGSRFAPQNRSTHERLSTNTVGLVALSDFRKRRAEVLEQQERESRDAAAAGGGGSSAASTPAPTPGTSTPDSAESDSAAPDGAQPLRKRPKKKGKKPGKKLLSFDDEDGEDDATTGTARGGSGDDKDEEGSGGRGTKFKANASVGMVPKAMTKAALLKEATEREALRREFLAMQEAVKATEIALPFVFYDGSNIPGGTVRVKKGDFVWLFLDKSRKVGAELGVGEKANATKNWARVGVDDLMLVRGTIIIPHHYDFYYFLVNKSVGPGGQRIFDFSAEATVKPSPEATGGLATPGSKTARSDNLPDVSTLEGANDEPTLTKVVDRRWYERNKHIYPASTWQDFDADKDYTSEVRRDTGGNTFFFSR